VFRSPAPIFNAASIAIVGASDRAKWPSTIWSNLKDFGYSGTVYPINPRREEVFGVPCYPDFASLPEPVELGLVIVPAKAVQGVLEDGVKNGLKAAGVYAGHIGEGVDPEVIARGDALQALCDETGLLVGGPNCMGGIGYREKSFLYPNAGLCHAAPGSVGAVFQSGGTMQFWVSTALSRGMRFSYAVSTGNELGLDLADYINFFVDDPETKSIVLFIEGIRRVDVFKEACARALAANKPILAIKTGRTQRSRDAARSHTGAIGGDWAGFEALCERYGIINCESLDDMIEMALVFQQDRLPKGPNIGFVTTSGGTVDLLYDYAEAEGAAMPAYGPETVEGIRPHIPAEMTPKNPLDCGIPAGSQTLADICEVVLKDKSVDMLALAAQISPGRTDIGAAAPIKALLDKTDMPIVGFGRMRYPMDESGVEFQDQMGIPYIQGLVETLRSLNALAFYGARAGDAVDLPEPPKGLAENLEGTAFDALLESNNITLPKSALVKDAEAAVKAAKQIGFPVVLKVVAPAFSHKTEVGGVLVGLDTENAVEEGVETLATRIHAVDANAEITGYLVQEMVSGVEMIMGCREDPLYGPVILLGTGGILVELMNDAVMRLLPVTKDNVRAMIDELKGKKLLEGFRGAAPADMDALVSAVVGLGQVYLDHRHVLADLEVNPLIVRPEGRGVAAVDVRPVLHED
jgi:acetyltransferase